MPSSPRNLKAAAWAWRSVVPSWNRMVAACGPHPTTDEARRFISLCQPQWWKAAFMWTLCRHESRAIPPLWIPKAVTDVTVSQNIDWVGSVVFQFLADLTD